MYCLELLETKNYRSYISIQINNDIIYVQGTALI